MENNNRTLSTYCTALKEAVHALLNEDFTQRHEQFLLSSAHTLATNLLRVKLLHTPAIKHHLGLNAKDLGYDCIAELFERDTHGHLIHFKTYFSNFDCQQLSEEEILLHFRRLVSSAVNQNLVHVYHNYDPSLGKILRNIKLAVVAHRTFEEVDRFDESCLAPIHCHHAEHLPAMDQEILFLLLAPHVRGDEFIPELLSIFSRCIREQEEYSRIIPVITIALTFRTLLVSKQNHRPGSLSGEEHQFEIVELIQKHVEFIKSSMVVRNNGHAKNHQGIMDIYFETITTVLLSKLDGHDGSAESLFEGLKQHMTQLNVHEYREHHRTKLEYYYKLCRESIAAVLVERKNL